MFTNLKQKPESYRKKVQIFSSLALTGIIAFVWITLESRGPIFNPQGQTAAAGEVRLTPVETLSKDASSVGGALGSFFNETKKRFGAVGEGIKSTWSSFQNLFK